MHCAASPRMLRCHAHFSEQAPQLQEICHQVGCGTRQHTAIRQPLSLDFTLSAPDAPTANLVTQYQHNNGIRVNFKRASSNQPTQRQHWSCMMQHTLTGSHEWPTHRTPSCRTWSTDSALTAHAPGQIDNIGSLSWSHARLCCSVVGALCR